jgi:uncharacterized delta-60 repeat protein
MKMLRNWRRSQVHRHAVFNARPQGMPSRPALETLEDRRLLNAGTLDRTFGDYGLIRDAAGTGPVKIALQPDGKIIVVGLTADPVIGSTQQDFLVQRYNSDGTVDGSFGTNGIAVVPVPQNQALQVGGVVVQPDGGIVVAGTALILSTRGDAVAVFRLNSDGTLDNGFGGGVVTEMFGTFDATANVLALQPDGRILIAGSITVNSTQDSLLAAFNPDGSLDQSFGNAGEATIDFPSGDPNGDPFSDVAAFNALTLEPDGRIVAGGFAQVFAGSLFGLPTYTHHLALAMYNPDGTPDPEFNGVGWKTGLVQASSDIQSMALRADGSIVVGGTEEAAGEAGLVFNFVGSFAQNGLAGSFMEAATGTYTTSAQNVDPICSIAVQQDGKIIVGTTSQFSPNGTTSSAVFTLTRLNLDSQTVDPGFGNPRDITSFGTGQDDGITSLVLQPDGEIVAAGEIDNRGAIGLARYHNDAGKVELDPSASGVVDESAGSVTLNVLRIGGSDGTITIHYSTADRTAVAGGDYVATSGVLSFADGQTSQSITIPLLEDGGLGGSESFAVNLVSEPGDAALVPGDGIATVTIDAPRIRTAPVSSTEGASFTASVATFVGSNPNADALDYAATIDWGNGTTSPGTITPVAGTNQFNVTGTGLYTSPGTMTFTVNISGADTLSATGTVNVADAPLTATPLNLTVTGGAQFKGVVATFSDANPLAHAADFTATIVWDNGTTSTGTIQGKGPFVVIGSHFFPTFKGAHSLVVTIYDVSSSAQITDTITDPPKNELFVLNLYQDLLHRPADDAGLAYWTGLLDQGQSRLAIVEGIQGSYEYRADEVEALYSRYLYRQADPSGLATFTQILAKGGTIEGVSALIAGSREYYQSRGSGTNLGFLQALYQDALDRNIDPSGQAFFGSLLTAGASPQDVATAIFASMEYRQDLVQADYHAYLQRSADPTGLKIFTTALAQDDRDEAIAGDILASDEFFQRI